MGFIGVLQTMFIAFKIAGLVEWSWFTTFLPLIIPIGGFGVVMIFALLIGLANSIGGN